MTRFNPTYEDEKRWFHKSNGEFWGYLMADNGDKLTIEISSVMHTLGQMPDNWVGKEIVFDKSEVEEINE